MSANSVTKSVFKKSGTSISASVSGDKLVHEAGGIEADISAVAKGDILAGSGTGAIGIIAASGKSDGDVLTLQADGTVDYEAAAGGGGGISHDGSTADGVLTYKDADEATVEANLTYDGTDLSMFKDSENTEFIISAYHDTEATTPQITLRKGDNTQASPALVDDDAVLGTISFQGYDGDSWAQGAKIEARAEGTPASDDMASELTFWTTPDSSQTAAQRMTIGQDGKVSIGDNATIIRSHFEVASSADTLLYACTSENTNDDADGEIAETKSIYPSGTTSTSHNASALYKLWVRGQASNDTYSSGWISCFKTTDSTSTRNATLTDWRIAPKVSGGDPVEKFRVSGGGDTYTNDGSVSSLSDVRVKKNIEDLTDGLDIVNQLRPRTFEYNGKASLSAEDGVTRYGFIADEVLECAPQYVELRREEIGDEGVDEEGKLINGTWVEDFKTLSTGRLIPMLVNAIQELSAKVEALENA